MPSITHYSALTLGVLAMACTRVTLRENADHCTNNEGDQYCAELFPDRPYCNQGKDECSIGDRYGCVAEVAPECHAPCGVLDEDECVAGSSTGTDAGTSSGSEESTASSSGESSTTGPVPCVGNEDCTDTAAPFCDVASGECVSCDATDDPDGACSALDPAMPLCVDGACVACTPENPAACTGTTPICDGATNSCVPCVAHDQCGGPACNFYTGACLPADRVFEVGGVAADYPNLSMAVADQAPGTETTFIVHPGMPSYDEAVIVEGGHVVAFLAAEIGPGITPGWIQSSAGVGPQLTVAAGATVLVDGLRLSGNADGVGLHVDGGLAWVDRSRIVQNSGGGVLAEAGAELILRNCFVGGSLDDVHALEVNGAAASVLYSTLGGGTFNASALTCTAAVTVDVRNSLLVTRGGTPPDEITCPAAVIAYSATEGAVGGEGNVAVGMFPGGSPGDWFQGYTTGDFHLQNDGLDVFADVAQWQAGDLLTDIDGDPRTAVDGTPDYAGADLPQ